MALRQTYLSLKNKLPVAAEAVLVMRGRGNDELAPSKALLDDFNSWKESFVAGQGYETAIHYAWEKSGYAARFRAEISANPTARTRLQALTELAKTRDVFLVCYEGYDKPCHRNLLLQIAEEEFGAGVDRTPYLPQGATKRKSEPESEQPTLF
jgi:uncharacterized protein YeaO (DUF488 family)